MEDESRRALPGRSLPRCGTTRQMSWKSLPSTWRAV